MNINMYVINAILIPGSLSPTTSGSSGRA